MREGRRAPRERRLAPPDPVRKPRQASAAPLDRRNRSSGPSLECIEQPQRFREARDSPFIRTTRTLESAARLLGSSTRSLQRVLQTSGESFAQLRDRARREIAAARLAHSDDKIDAVASDTGFRSRSHFVTWFRRLTGFSPAAFRAQHRRR